MLQVHAQFHPQYGFSWIVDDINPEYTMGDMMRKRQEIIRQLKAEGVFDLQKELCLPMFAQRIALSLLRPLLVMVTSVISWKLMSMDSIST